jgi:hypothetical protein
MKSPYLEALRSDEFHDGVGLVSMPSAVRRALLQSRVVRRLAAAIRYGWVDEKAIAAFVGEATGALQMGWRLPDDLALAALAVVLEFRQTPFAEEFLHDLARLKLVEMATSIAVAKECLINRYAMPLTQSKTVRHPGWSPARAASPKVACKAVGRRWEGEAGPRAQEQFRAPAGRP